jgi:O-antigen ligase
MLDIKDTTNKYIFSFLIPLFIFLSVIYLIVKNLVVMGSFDEVFIISGVLVILLLFISVFDFEKGLLALLFLTCVINSIPVIIIKLNLFYPLILFAYLGFVLGGRFRASEAEIKLFEEDNKFKILGFFIILFTITITISVVFTSLNNFNLFNLKGQGIHIYNINVIGSTSLSALLFSMEMYLNYIMTFILLFLMVKKLKVTRRFLVRLFYILFSANIIVFLVFIYQVFFDKRFGNQPRWIKVGQLNSTMFNPNAYGFFLFLNIGIFTALLFYLNNKKHKILCLPVLLVLPVQILYSGSRASLMGLVIFAGLVISYFLLPAMVNLIKKRKVNKNDVRVAVTVLVLLIIVPLIFSLAMLKSGMDWDSDIVRPSLLLRLVKNLEQLQLEDPLPGLTSGRTIIWPQAFNVIRDYPVVGIGIGTFPLELPNYLKLAGSDLRIIDYTLNTYLQILAENGIFTFIFFMGFYVTLLTIIFNNLRKISRAKNKKFLVIFIFIIFTCLAMFNFISGTNYYEGQIIYSFILIITILLSYNLRENELCEK